MKSSINFQSLFILKEIEDVDGLLCLLTEKVDEDVINKAKHLKVISNVAVGYDNIDIQVASRKGIIVTNTPGVLTETTADLTLTLLMATAWKLSITCVAVIGERGPLCS
ncbi:hypothetical protein [Aeribacillus pallidus]|uniref:hypothetical protein n=1 Tax=Aeribacillus pallidus TaxID=33936 RepID=UPI0026CEF13F